MEPTSSIPLSSDEIESSPAFTKDENTLQLENKQLHHEILKLQEEVKQLRQNKIYEDGPKYSFMDLWNKFGEIPKRFQSEYKNMEKFIKFFKKRGKVLERVSNLRLKTYIHDEGDGSLSNAVNTIMRLSHDCGIEYLQMAKSYENIIHEFQDFMEIYINTVKRFQIEEMKYRRDLLKSNEECKNEKQREVETKKSCENKLQMMRDKIDPVALQSILTTMSLAEYRYKASTQAQNFAHARYFEVLSEMMNHLENLDKKRILLFKSTLQKFRLLEVHLQQTIMRNVETLNQKISAIDPDYEIQSFIKRTRTGEIRPPPEKFEPYIVKVKYFHSLICRNHLKRNVSI